jgi:protein-tyrosine phosphatase
VDAVDAVEDDGVVGADRFSVLIVCSANICRSPAAALLLTEAVADVRGVEIASAGLKARVGSPVDPTMAALLGPLAAAPFSARQAGPDLMRAADVLLAMTRAQRGALAAWVPGAVRRCFTLLEFADLAVLCRERGALAGRHSVRERFAAVVQEGPRLRAYRTPGAADDIADPYGKEGTVYRAVLTQIKEAVDILGEVLRDADG